MAGRKFGVIMMARSPEIYFALSAAEQAKPGKAFDQTLKKYAGKVDLVRRYWTSAFSADVSNVFVFECDDMADMQAFTDDLNRAMAGGRGVDPAKYGVIVDVTAGVNPDADAPKKRRR